MLAAVTARDRLLTAAVDAIRAQGLHATTVDELCAAAGVTKGAFFHHFPSKEALAVAAAEHWGTLMVTMFDDAPYRRAADPIDRVLGYLDLRAAMHDDDPAHYTCLAGTMVQEAFRTQPAVRAACAAALFGQSAILEDDLDAALATLDPRPADITAEGLARFVQTVLQGAYVLAKAADDPQPLLDGIEHLRRYFRLLFHRPEGAPS